LAEKKTAPIQWTERRPLRGKTIAGLADCYKQQANSFAERKKKCLTVRRHHNNKKEKAPETAALSSKRQKKNQMERAYKNL
jgi:hypothetical protein